MVTKSNTKKVTKLDFRVKQKKKTKKKKDAELPKIADSLAERANLVEQAVYRIDCAIDEVQQ